MKCLVKAYFQHLSPCFERSTLNAVKSTWWDSLAHLRTVGKYALPFADTRAFLKCKHISRRRKADGLKSPSSRLLAAIITREEEEEEEPPTMSTKGSLVSPSLPPSLCGSRYAK